ncbi:hypothetical protein ET33_09670 [Paenibacillus tyrfis]|uniref:Uncharacterized protein n=1 Tax=Paenibacillus tyrfis TaxID=1501230 RepID=A0A081P1F9_9BACL|nr:hypothetical protein ET33_09670 [Paenibacillus tyrfis]
MRSDDQEAFADSGNPQGERVCGSAGQIGYSFKFAFSFYHLNRSPGDKEASVENFRYLIRG